MKSPQDFYTLNNGVKIPCIGFGMWQTPSGEVAVESVKEAIAAGYRHIDTAAAYRNEASVGEGIRRSGVPREQIFITSKLGNNMHGYDETLRAFDETMDNLGCGYLDLYLIHWPNPKAYRDRWQSANEGTWRAFEELYKAGRIKAIGVSNFMSRHLDALLKTANVIPAVNQVRLCPGETQEDASAACAKHGILLEAYSPLGTGLIFDVPEMKAFAAKYAKSIAQICVRWSLQMGYLPLPKSVTPARIRENIDVFDFELEEADVKAIAALKDCCGPSRDPDTTPF